MLHRGNVPKKLLLDKYLQHTLPLRVRGEAVL